MYIVCDNVMQNVNVPLIGTKRVRMQVLRFNVLSTGINQLFNDCKRIKIARRNIFTEISLV